MKHYERITRTIKGREYWLDLTPEVMKIMDITIKIMERKPENKKSKPERG